MKKGYQYINDEQESFLKSSGFYKDRANSFLKENTKPFLATAIMWLEKKYNVLFVTDIIGYQFLTIVKKERTALFHSEFQKTPDDSKSKALDLFIKKIKK